MTIDGGLEDGTKEIHPATQEHAAAGGTARRHRRRGRPGAERAHGDGLRRLRRGRPRTLGHPQPANVTAVIRYH